MPCLLLPRRRGLIVNTTFWDRGKALGSLPYDVAKTAVNCLAYMLALELRAYNVAAVALSPGWMRTEAVRAHNHTPEELKNTESVEYIGRAVAALAADPNVMAKSGRVLAVGDLAREYYFTDVDGGQPRAFGMSEPRD